jgi:hypothetical protein
VQARVSGCIACVAGRFLAETGVYGLRSNIQRAAFSLDEFNDYVDGVRINVDRDHPNNILARETCGALLRSDHPIHSADMLETECCTFSQLLFLHKLLQSSLLLLTGAQQFIMQGKKQRFND